MAVRDCSGEDMVGRQGAEPSTTAQLGGSSSRLGLAVLRLRQRSVSAEAAACTKRTPAGRESSSPLAEARAGGDEAATRRCTCCIWPQRSSLSSLSRRSAGARTAAVLQSASTSADSPPLSKSAPFAQMPCLFGQAERSAGVRRGAACVRAAPLWARAHELLPLSSCRALLHVTHAPAQRQQRRLGCRWRTSTRGRRRTPHHLWGTWAARHLRLTRPIFLLPRPDWTTSNRDASRGGMAL